MTKSLCLGFLCRIKTLPLSLADVSFESSRPGGSSAAHEGPRGAAVSITEKMQCVKLLKKRSLDLEPWNCCKTKRVCLGAGLQDDCPMETCDSLNLSNQPLLQLQPQLQPLVQSQLQLQPVVQLQQNKQLFPSLKPDPGPAPVCVRCLRGEPGHINHILGR